MLQVKSFNMDDDKGMNDLLKKYRIAPGATIMVTEGKICIPYEDGEAMSPSQRLVTLKEERNRIMEKIEIIEHSQAVLKNKYDGAKEQLEQFEIDLKELEANNDKKVVHDKIQTLKEKIKQNKNVIDQLTNSRLQSQAELTHQREDLKVYVEEIQKLNNLV